MSNIIGKHRKRRTRIAVATAAAAAVTATGVVGPVYATPDNPQSPQSQQAQPQDADPSTRIQNGDDETPQSRSPQAGTGQDDQDKPGNPQATPKNPQAAEPDRADPDAPAETPNDQPRTSPSTGQDNPDTGQAQPQDDADDQDDKAAPDEGKKKEAPAPKRQGPPKTTERLPAGPPFAEVDITVYGTPYLASPVDGGPGVEVAWTDGVPQLPAPQVPDLGVKLPTAEDLGIKLPPPPVVVNITQLKPGENAKKSQKADKGSSKGKAPKVKIVTGPPLPRI